MYNAEYLYQIGVMTMLTEYMKWYYIAPVSYTHLDVYKRQVHEAWILAKRAEVEFWRELKLDIAKKGVWGLLVLITGLLITGLSIKSGVWFR